MVKTVIKGIWITLMSMSYVGLIYMGKNPEWSDASKVFGLVMYILSFPISLLVGFIMLGLTYLGDKLGWIPDGASYAVNLFFWTIGWILFLASGYFQWFVFIPCLYRKISHKKYSK